MFVTYLTIYDGDKLPPFYIGSTSQRRIDSGYLGSVRGVEYGAIWKEEITCSPELFDVVILSEHSTREEALVEEQRLHVKHDVVRNPQFINTATARGGFINRGYWTEEEKQRMRKQHVISHETRRIMAENTRRIHIGRKNTPETIERMRQAALTRKKAPPQTAEHRAKVSAAITASWARRKSQQKV